MAALVAGLFFNASLVQAADHVDCQLVTVNQEAKIVAPDATTEDLFGFKVAIDSDTMVVSSLLDDDDGNESGSAYIYVRDGSEWTLQAKLTASDATAGDWFARDVGIDGDTVVIGANKTDDLGYWSGSAYVFVRNGTTWTQQAKLTASDGELGDLFGVSLEVDGDTVVVGARWDDNDAVNNAGGAYVFVRNGTTWTQQAKLTAPAADIITSGEFGEDVTIDNNTIVVAGGTLEGAKSYVYVRDGNEWTLEARLDGGYPAISDDTILVSGKSMCAAARHGHCKQSLPLCVIPQTMSGLHVRWRVTLLSLEHCVMTTGRKVQADILFLCVTEQHGRSKVSSFLPI